MKILLIGATGNLGLRLVAALLTHGHIVIAYVRSSRKLELLLPSNVYSQIIVVEGDATNTALIKGTILENDCDAVVNTAGVAAMAPWNKSDLPEIFSAVLKAVQQAGSERKEPLRVWFLAGLGVLHFPGTNTMLSNYQEIDARSVPIFLEYRQNIRLLRALSPHSHDDTREPGDQRADKDVRQLTACATTPPVWMDSWLKYIPFLGKVILAAMNASRYDTTLEQNAEFIASDLEDRDSRWIGVPVGIIDAKK
ncbi:NAD(P)-binding protein [Aureobasidium pullulans]|uniref:NAD(P)-binding protein n=1 Tax=Aureobasidium pullulans TaxID=5580 RepID=A0A4V4KHQ3_AURPU|nr:NAD(P)-binding protein [Aureobasidium pullulans]